MKKCQGKEIGAEYVEMNVAKNAYQEQESLMTPIFLQFFAKSVTRLI